MIDLLKKSFLIVTAFLLVSCATMVRNMTSGLVGGVLQQEDMALLEDGAPAYLLLIESLLVQNPTNRDFLMAGVQTFSSYSSAFVKEPTRKALFDKKIKNWSAMLLDTYPLYKKFAQTNGLDKNKALEKFLASMKKSDVPYVFWGYFGTLSNILSGGMSDPGVLMVLPEVVSLASRIYELDHTFMDGIVHLFFGAYNCVYPESFGGSFDKGKEEFDLAIEISCGNQLLYKVLYAEFYYKPIFDRDSYEALLEEVVAFDLELAPKSRIMNKMAQDNAKKLLAEIDSNF